MIIYFCDRQMWAGEGHKERETQIPAQSSNSYTVRPWTELWMLNQLSHPDVSGVFLLLISLIMHNWGVHMCAYINTHIKGQGAPGWLSLWEVLLWLRSWSHGSWVRVPQRALCWQLGAWSLLQILCLPFSCPSPTHALFLSFKNKD